MDCFACIVSLSYLLRNDVAQAEVAALARRLAKVNDLSGVSQKFGMLQQQQPNMKQQQQQQQQSLEHAYKPRQFQ